MNNLSVLFLSSAHLRNKIQVDFYVFQRTYIRGYVKKIVTIITFKVKKTKKSKKLTDNNTRFYNAVVVIVVK